MLWGINSKDFQNRKTCSANFLQWGKACAVQFGIFQIMADEQCKGEILLVGDQCESAFEYQGKSDQLKSSHPWKALLKGNV